jgi:hypothetical protein
MHPEAIAQALASAKARIPRVFEATALDNIMR